MADTSIYNPEELKEIQSILEPLNSNPAVTEVLNPLAKVLRAKLGHAEPIVISSDEDAVPTESLDDGLDDLVPDENLQEEEAGPPKKKIFSEEDDIDLDELLKESSPDEQKPADLDQFEPGDDVDPTKDETPFDDFLTEQPELGEQAVEKSEIDEGFDAVPTVEEDPFKDFGFEPNADVDPTTMEGTTSGMEAFGTQDPFAIEEGTETFEKDPFSEFETVPTENTDEMASGIDDGAMGFPDAVPTTTTDEMFSGLDAEFPATEEQAIGFEASEPAEDNPFGESPSAVGLEDPFASLGNMEFEQTAETQPLSMPPEIDDKDPFADFGKFDMGPSGSGEKTFEDFGSDFSDSASMPADDFGIGDDSEPTKISEVSSIEDDLSSLADDSSGGNLEEGLTDEDLAYIQQEIVKYPPKLKRAVIDAIVNDRIPFQEQKGLLELIKANQKPEDIASYLSGLLGHKVELYDTTGAYSKEGIPIIATNPVYTKEGLYRQRQLIKRTFLFSAAAILVIAGLISGYRYLWRPFQASQHYDLGLIEIRKAIEEKNEVERKKHLADAEIFFQKGEKIEPSSLEYLNKYGILYMRAGEYERSFEKLFGKVQPDYGMEASAGKNRSAWSARREIPVISMAKNQSWSNAKLPLAGKIIPETELMKLTSQDRVERKILKAGAYIVSRLEKDEHHIQTYLNLGRFHSGIARTFTESELRGSIRYKNDDLAIEYYKEVFTDAMDPHNVDALSGIAKIYYNKKEFGKAAGYYNKIVERFPKNPIGHGGILSTYIEMWKKDKNPQFVINHHRQVRNALGIEDELSIFVLTKLASFYTDLDSSEIRIRYNINPEDQVTGLEINDNVEYLLNLAYKKKEKIDGETFSGSDYAEGYYQRGRFYYKMGETLRAMKQYEFAAHNDPAHYMSVLAMAEHYMRLYNFKESSALLKNASDRFNKYRIYFGSREEDETLLEGDPGRIYFDMGKMIYLHAAGLDPSTPIHEFPGRKIYPDRSIGNKPAEEMENRRRELRNALKYFEMALNPNRSEETLKEESIRRELYFYRGWVEYMSSNYRGAIDEWSNLGEEDVYSNHSLLLGKAHAYFYTNQLNAALGNYLKIKEDLEEREKSMSSAPVPEDMSHQEVYQTLTAVYNNIGAVYELRKNQAEALKYYWKAIETARRISVSNEIATSNKDLLFRDKLKNRKPLLEDWLPPTLDSIKELKSMKLKNK